MRKGLLSSNKISQRRKSVRKVFNFSDGIERRIYNPSAFRLLRRCKYTWQSYYAETKDTLTFGGEITISRFRGNIF